MTNRYAKSLPQNDWQSKNSFCIEMLHDNTLSAIHGKLWNFGHQIDKQRILWRWRPNSLKPVMQAIRISRYSFVHGRKWLLPYPYQCIVPLRSLCFRQEENDRNQWHCYHCPLHLVQEVAMRIITIVAIRQLIQLMWKAGLISVITHICPMFSLICRVRN